jgi:2-polyprenyl-6-methoxyphenol hydroxylase-like FAD-dependent oxidoreductase
MRNGQEFTGRVLVMATGPSERARRLLGVRSDRVENHTLTVGFSIVPARGRAFPFQSLTYYGAHGDRLGYVNFFPMNGAMRINLFCYPTDPQRWIREFRDAPMQALFRMAPDLESHIRGASAVDEAQMRVSHIVQATDYRRDGFVLLGEAFRSTCPATGTGALCVLNDVERLCKVHLPKWLSSDEMSAASLASFYDDPVKVACDARSRLLARRLRGMAVGGGIIWGMRHTVSDLRSRLGCARDGLRRRWSEKFYGKGRLENA